jgi:hypothetical protein
MPIPPKDVEAATAAAVARFHHLFEAGTPGFACRAFAVPGVGVAVAEVLTPSLFLVTAYTPDGAVLGVRSASVVQTSPPADPLPRILPMKKQPRATKPAG